MSGMYTSGLIGLTEENVGIDRRFYTNRTDTNPTLAVSYNNGRVDVYLNGVKLVGNHAGNSNHDYTMDNVTGTGTTITLATGVALVATDVLELVGYVSNSSNTVQTYNFNVTTNTTEFTASHTASSLVNVYLNGVLLDSSDYTLNGSDTVTLGSNAVNGDVVAIQVIGALDHSDFVSATDGGTFSGDVSFGDNNKAQFGASNDLQIYHTGAYSAIVDDGAGNLVVASNDLQMTNAGITENYIRAYNNDRVELYYDNGEKLRTTSTGVEVTGNVKLSANGGINFNAYATSGNPSSNLLDDYEEGSISSVTISGSNSGSGSVTCSGSYTKVGRLVTLTVSIANQTFPTFSGQLQCSLPFTVGSIFAHGPDAYYFPQANWDQQTNWVGMKAQASAGQSFCVFPYIVLDSDRQSVLTDANTVVSGTSNLFLAFSLTYQTA